MRLARKLQGARVLVNLGTLEGLGLALVGRYEILRTQSSILI